MMVKVVLPVGTKFYVGDDLLIVEECEQSNCDTLTCDGCYFFVDNSPWSFCPLHCDSWNRKDRKDVIFKKVEEPSYEL